VGVEALDLDLGQLVRGMGEEVEFIIVDKKILGMPSGLMRMETLVKSCILPYMDFWLPNS